MSGWCYPALREFTVYETMNVVELINCLRYSPYLTSLSLRCIAHINTNSNARVSINSSTTLPDYLPLVEVSQSLRVKLLSFSCNGGDPSSLSLSILFSRVPHLQSLTISDASFHHIRRVVDIATGTYHYSDVPTTTAVVTDTLSSSSATTAMVPSVMI
jgi:hypothetical protein